MWPRPLVRVLVWHGVVWGPDASVRRASRGLSNDGHPLREIVAERQRRRDRGREAVAERQWQRDRGRETENQQADGQMRCYTMPVPWGGDKSTLPFRKLRATAGASERFSKLNLIHKAAKPTRCSSACDRRARRRAMNDKNNWGRNPGVWALRSAASVRQNGKLAARTRLDSMPSPPPSFLETSRAGFCRSWHHDCHQRTILAEGQPCARLRLATYR